jgi:hypothetical protein
MVALNRIGGGVGYRGLRRRRRHSWVADHGCP